MRAPVLTPMDDEFKAKLIHLMKTFHAGQGRAAKKKDLLVELYGGYAAEDESYNNAYDRTLRGTIEEINQEGGLICSSASDGYWWAESLDDGLEAAERNKKRALTQLENARRLEKNLRDEYGGQLALRLE